ncbi:MULTISPECIES: preprotein translocase subunit SecE [Bacillaceae]|uniref:preprotein translocase subunit SecE n=1 Tax=Bacillaceae TaxID=186817 RepID=UPI001BDE4143|nr:MULTISPECIES: preprotein translocase subunit SecE [Bacillaceae]MDX8363092.1 preprotein translocase subunit SecE [Cytobacillus sp. IB215316]
MKRLTTFLRDVVREMKKVSWPKQKELTRYTITVLSTVVFFVLFFALTDQIISFLIELVVE